MAADVICRREVWPRLKSLHKRLYEDAETRPFSTFNPAMPWDGVITASFQDNEFWNKHILRAEIQKDNISVAIL